MSNGTPLQEPARVPTLKREPFPPLPVSRGCLFSPRAELGPLLFSPQPPCAPDNLCLSRVLMATQPEPPLLLGGCLVPVGGARCSVRQM